jgi:hypothetical protein
MEEMRKVCNITVGNPGRTKQLGNLVARTLLLRMDLKRVVLVCRLNTSEKYIF